MKQTIDQLSEADARRVEAAFDCIAPRVLPSEWGKGPGFSNAQWYRSEDLSVCLEVELVDGSLWIHLSLSRPRRMPEYADLAEAKRTFLGPHRKAIMVLPAESEHYNLHPYCLHLYAPIDSDPLPDFRTKEGRL